MQVVAPSDHNKHSVTVPQKQGMNQRELKPNLDLKNKRFFAPCKELALNLIVSTCGRELLHLVVVVV